MPSMFPTQTGMPIFQTPSPLTSFLFEIYLPNHQCVVRNKLERHNDCLTRNDIWKFIRCNHVLLAQFCHRDKAKTNVFSFSYSQ